MNSEIKLTQFSKGSGCGCKIAPAVLESILKQVKVQSGFSNLIAGNENNEDAAVWKLNDEQYLLSTTDFFTPIVDDAYSFGKIAATNALSDIYAMGGKPIFALAILGFPVDKLPIELVGEIMRGASDLCAEAGIPIAGGHSIDIPEPVFGLVVNGLVKPASLKKNKGAKVGDKLFLTKALGSGVIAAAQKRGVVDQKHLDAAIESMCKLNSIGEKLAQLEGVHAMTDVTGFGLVGHLIEMCEASIISATLNYKNLKLLPGVEDYMAKFIFPDNTYRNWNAYEKKVSGVNGPEFIPLCDPQTSGGLLISVASEKEEEVRNFWNHGNGLMPLC
ncbi:MAG: selenide, water dikinase SelD [Bacteroidetes bacterium]|nr:selenide, water dikinase SelD [Bacteroidota bacterium]